MNDIEKQRFVWLMAFATAASGFFLLLLLLAAEFSVPLTTGWMVAVTLLFLVILPLLLLIGFIASLKLLMNQGKRGLPISCAVINAAMALTVIIVMQGGCHPSLQVAVWRGSPEAKFALGNRLLISKAHAFRGMALTQEAAEAGVPKAMLAMADIYAGKVFTLPTDVADRAKEEFWYRKAAEADPNGWVGQDAKERLQKWFLTNELSTNGPANH